MSTLINQLNIKAMKKVLLALAVVALIIGASSCNKQQKCQCTYRFGGLSYDTDVFLTEEGRTCSEYEAEYNYSEIDCHRVY